MKFKVTTPLLAALGALVLVGTLFLSFYLSTSAYRSDGTGIVLPSEQDAEPVVTQDDALDERMLKNIEITTDNVQKVIATLSRPAAYSYQVSNTLFYTDRQHTLLCQQNVLADKQRTDTLSDDGEIIQTTLRIGDQFYAWKPDSTQYFSGKNGGFSDDSAAMLPTYETVLALDKQALTEAGMVNLEYIPCIYVGMLQQNYRSIYYISTITGMLVRADFYKDDALVRQCVVSNFTEEIPEESLFQLPDGAAINN